MVTHSELVISYISFDLLILFYFVFAVWTYDEDLGSISILGFVNGTWNKLLHLAALIFISVIPQEHALFIIGNIVVLGFVCYSVYRNYFWYLPIPVSICRMIIECFRLAITGVFLTDWINKYQTVWFGIVFIHLGLMLWQLSVCIRVLF